MSDLVRSVETFLYYTPIGEFMRESRWAWPVWESLHFLGMSLLVGTVGLFDLRLLGFARGVPIPALHRLIPLGVSGFVLNGLTGICFICATPDQYLYNDAFRVKAVLILVAGCNILFFYGRVFRRIGHLGPGDQAPVAARVAGGISLAAWIGVMAAGRLLTFFRPPD